MGSAKWSVVLVDPRMTQGGESVLARPRLREHCAPQAVFTSLAVRTEWAVVRLELWLGGLGPVGSPVGLATALPPVLTGFRLLC